MFMKNKYPRCCFDIPVFGLDYELFLPLKTFELVTHVRFAFEGQKVGKCQIYALFLVAITD